MPWRSRVTRPRSAATVVFTLILAPPLPARAQAPSPAAPPVAAPAAAPAADPPEPIAAGRQGS